MCEDQAQAQTEEAARGCGNAQEDPRSRVFRAIDELHEVGRIVASFQSSSLKALPHDIHGAAGLITRTTTRLARDLRHIFENHDNEAHPSHQTRGNKWYYELGRIRDTVQQLADELNVFSGPAGEDPRCDGPENERFRGPVGIGTVTRPQRGAQVPQDLLDAAAPANEDPPLGGEDILNELFQVQELVGTDRGMLKVTVGDMIGLAIENPVARRPKGLIRYGEAKRYLGDIGFIVDQGHLYVALASRWIRRQLLETFGPAAFRWPQLLLSIPGAEKDPPRYFSKMLRSRTVRIPIQALSLIADDYAPPRGKINYSRLKSPEAAIDAIEDNWRSVEEATSSEERRNRIRTVCDAARELIRMLETPMP